MSVARQVPQPAPEPPVQPTANVSAGEGYKNSESSRLLCAAAYLNSGFRKQVVKKYSHEQCKAFAPSFGIDLATVVQHCHRAERKLNQREWWLLLPAAVIGYIWLSNASAVVVTPETAANYALIVVAAYLLGFAICLFYDWHTNFIVTHNFIRGRFDPDTLLELEDQNIGHLRASEGGNVLIYSGFTPFVGSGLNLTGWSFALDLRKPCEPGLGAVTHSPEETASNTPRHARIPEEVSIHALYDRVSSDLAELDLDRLSVEDKLYVNGQDIRDDKRFLRNPLSAPQNHVDAEVVRNAMLESEQRLRHYRCIRVVDWSGELVLSIFLRFSKLSHNLFAEASYFLLTPVATQYRRIDSMTPHLTFRRVFSMITKAAFATPFLILLSPLILLGRAHERVSLWLSRREQRKCIVDNPSYDYGADFSLRQWASSNEYQRYFQKLDKEMYLKVLEKNILDSILSFLEEKNVDVSELKQRQTAILNTGVIVSGGTLAAGSLAVGEGAKTSTTTNVTNRISRFAAKAAAVAGKH